MWNLQTFWVLPFWYRVSSYLFRNPVPVFGAPQSYLHQQSTMMHLHFHKRYFSYLPMQVIHNLLLSPCFTFSFVKEQEERALTPPRTDTSRSSPGSAVTKSSIGESGAPIRNETNNNRSDIWKYKYLREIYKYFQYYCLIPCQNLFSIRNPRCVCFLHTSSPIIGRSSWLVRASRRSSLSDTSSFFWLHERTL